MKILYTMHIPWSWIKQRPHFIAEQLAKYYDVTVFDKMAFLKRNKVRNDSAIKIKHLFRIPGERIPFISYVDGYFIGLQLRQVIRNYDCLWMSDPLMYDQISSKVKNGQLVVFDCMDDYFSFPMIQSSRFMKKHYINCEKKLIHRADLILVSSAYLGKVISRRQLLDPRKTKVINNALTDDWINYHLNNLSIRRKIIENSYKKRIVYIGTISQWFDFDILKKSLENFNDIEYQLYGPHDVEIPKIEGIKYMGIANHNDVPNIMQRADMLIMPFRLTSLVRSVNPVKLYEYLLVNKPIMAIRYEESEKFQDYIYLYSNYSDYRVHIKALSENKLAPKKSHKEVHQFLIDNTWAARVKKIREMLNDLK